MFVRVVVLLWVMISFVSSAAADAMTDGQARASERERLCGDYATGDPSRAVSNYELGEKLASEKQTNSNFDRKLRLPRFGDKPQAYWEDEMNSHYDADGVPNIGVQIVVCREAKEPRLLIPPKLSSFIRKDLKNLEVSESAAPSRLQTIALGILMSLAMVSGGVWLIRNKQSRNFKIVAILGIASLGLFISTTILASTGYGDALRSKQRIVRDIQNFNIAQDFQVQFYVMEDRSDLKNVVLIVPQNYSKPKEMPLGNYPRATNSNADFSNSAPTLPLVFDPSLANRPSANPIKPASSIQRATK